MMGEPVTVGGVLLVLGVIVGVVVVGAIVFAILEAIASGYRH